MFNVRTETELNAFPRLKERFDNRELLYLVAYDGDKVAGWSASYQSKIYELYTKNSVVLPEYRRRGIYSLLTKRILNLARERGYQMVSSHHVVANNSVIVAKLKMEFFITGYELTDDYGSLVKMTYFINEKRRKAFEVRSGIKKPDAEMKEILNIP